MYFGGFGNSDEILKGFNNKAFRVRGYRGFGFSGHAWKPPESRP